MSLFKFEFTFSLVYLVHVSASPLPCKMKVMASYFFSNCLCKCFSLHPRSLHPRSTFKTPQSLTLQSSVVASTLVIIHLSVKLLLMCLIGRTSEKVEPSDNVRLVVKSLSISYIPRLHWKLFSPLFMANLQLVHSIQRTVMIFL